ncbi:putative cytochrome P450 YjiB [Thermogymnomonas acidicola]|uniref:Cytochrome P450 YjiB n=1 Tax=Thermogymnomonas acidicola TaxID=399579 RepID=A0AA37BRQ1_9ARCH|nr:cytochrome P450 [Thermogymnomonas acidicola]GGM74540.1 putative cytochrome P450 YjiB [Thermogymnomonas acidicola]
MLFEGIDWLNPFEQYRVMRDRSPVYYDSYDGSWNLFLYEDVARALSEHQTFSSQLNEAAEMPLSQSLIQLDPPRHTRLRALVSKPFSPAWIGKRADKIREICTSLLESVKSDQFDFVRNFSYPLPVMVIADIIGIPRDHMERFKEWSDAVVTGQAFMGQRDYMSEMVTYFSEMVRERQRDPRDDLISMLISSEVDGKPLSPQELMGFLILLLIAGNETTTNLISNAVYSMNENPGTYDMVVSDRSLIPGMLEETLRYRSPVQSMFRRTKADVTVRGVTIPANSYVTAWIGSANHDERVFEEPEKFNIERKENRHIAFGNGIHYCLGAPLARLEAKIAFEEITERFREIRVGNIDSASMVSSTIVYGFKSLPVSVVR